jgi:glycosyltransferase involved in cell wall biosynthesis
VQGGRAGPGGVSVIIPAFNCARYIGETIASIQAQTIAPLEIIIVDDGSTDDTAAAIRAVNDPRIQYVGKPNGGISSARNTGLTRARGEFFAFLDADDRWRPSMLERQLQVMAADASLVCSITNFVRFVDGTGEMLPDQFSFCPEFDAIPTRALPVSGAFAVEGDAFTALVQFGEHPTWTQSMLFRRSLMGDLRFDESFPLAEDTLYSLLAFLRGGVAFNREPLAEIRRHGSNTTADYEMVGIHRVRALHAVTRIVTDGPRRAALDARLVRAHITAARVLARRGERRQSLAQFAGVARVPGSYVRKVKGGIRLMVDLLQPAR